MFKGRFFGIFEIGGYATWCKRAKTWKNEVSTGTTWLEIPILRDAEEESDYSGSGGFCRSKALRAVAGYLREHQAEVTAFYVSNVEEYIASPQSVWTAYCRNIATLPMNQTSTFIRFGRGGRGSFLGAMMPFTRNCVLQ
jgi:hypothetical protein